jgi:hypothetical protein
MNQLTVVAIITSATLALVVPSAAGAQALDILNPPLQMQAKKKSAKHKKSGSKTTFSSGSQETTKERTARLQRECKGAVNAGACAGYTR